METGAIMEEQSASILVVDDNRTNRLVLSKMLMMQGYRVVLAENGREALSLVASNTFDMILLDIMMPEMDGYQVLEYLQADSGLRHIPVVMISTITELDSVVRCIKMGAEDYLPKPFNMTLLNARVSASLEKKRWRDREQEYLRQLAEERRRADDLLHVILPGAIVRELKETNGVCPRRYEDVAVLFCDIVDFTAYCDGHSPEEVVHHLQYLVKLYEQAAIDHRVQKIKTIGDAFMAVAGLLERVENPVLNCVCLGIDMVEAVQRSGPGWSVRVGVHVGSVMAGIIGDRQYLFDVWGDTVNTAQRIENAAQPNTVQVSKNAWRCISHCCDGESAGIVSVKGKGPLEMNRVVNVPRICNGGRQ